MKTQMIHARINSNLKHEAEQVFKTLGINTTDAIRMFLNYVTLHKALPFQEQTNYAIHAMEAPWFNRNLPIYSSY